MGSGEKTCTSCKRVKPLEEFWNSKNGLYGKHSKCKECAVKQNRAWRAKNKERDAHKKREYYLIKKYNVTLADYSTLLEFARGCCEICGVAEENAVNGYLCVDHDHSTGEVRGLLYNKCNTALGLLNDSARDIEAALEYLGKETNHHLSSDSKPSIKKAPRGRGSRSKSE